MRKLLACVLVAFQCVLVRADLPPAFSDLTLDAAKKQVDSTDKVVVVKFTAEWCPPCKAMDKTTWRDESVVKWVKDHGVAIQVDVDKDQKTAMAYNIEAMPTMVMLRGGKEIARTLGYMAPAQMLEWMEAAATGKAVTSTTPSTGKTAKPAATLSPVQLLIADLRKKVADKKYAESVSIVQEIWSDKNVDDPMRRNGLVPEVREQLAATLAGTPEAKSAFGAIRDRAEEAKDEGTPRARAGELVDWLAWNGLLGDDARSLAWFDRTKTDENAGVYFSIGLGEIVPLLIRSGHAEEIPGAAPDASAELQRRHEIVSSAAKSAETADATRSAEALSAFEVLGAQVYAGYVAAKNIKDANEIAETMLQLRDTPTMRAALVRESLNAGVVGPGAKLWLDEAAKAGLDVSELRTRLAAIQKR